MTGDSRASDSDAREDEETETGLEQALAQARGRFVENPTSPIRRRDLIEIHKTIGKRHLRRGDKRSALTHCDEILKHFEGLLTLTKHQEETKHEISICQIELGDLRRALGDEIGALVAYGEALAICEKLVTKDPHNARYNRDLAIAKWRTSELDSRNRDRFLQSAHDHLLCLQDRGALDEADMWMIDAIKEQWMADGPSCSLWQRMRSFFL
ncbi:hypothetical protein [uncultured Cohaesibacter sp.]|uniref:hypothetical protein n=1 Tax=uncultured Cohaesibacter sp. TaxID=1002546 RepID=UPI002AAC1611|nr:hypothetical protein [uncultured Cohaesibacter sp.]